MKKILTAALTAGLLTVGVSVPAEALTRNDRQYLQAVRSADSALRRIPNRTLIDSARTTCRYLRSGATIDDVFYTAVDAGLTRKTATALIAGAITFYCPDQRWKVG